MTALKDVADTFAKSAVALCPFILVATKLNVPLLKVLTPTKVLLPDNVGTPDKDKFNTPLTELVKANRL